MSLRDGISLKIQETLNKDVCFIRDNLLGSAFNCEDVLLHLSIANL